MSFGLVVLVAAVAGMLGGGLVSGVIAAVGALAASDEPERSEPTSGSSAGTSTPGAVSPGPQRGTITHPGQRVPFPLHIAEARMVTIFVSGEGLDPTVRLLDAQGAQLGFDDDGGGGLNSRLMLHLQPGQYTVEVGGFSSSTGSFVYTVQ